jgi:hypothetical protein
MASTTRVRHDWFQAYAAAILEADVERIPERVAAAQCAIAERVNRLEAGDQAASHEPRDLQDALGKLQILLNVSREIAKTPRYPHPSTRPEQSRVRL